ncbi:hypothetical protein EXIGLDRAFT_731337 [Exidia glandulosa HHB12029]|uniref:Ser-Thr-rich glycosyl-phosphatidyl-inositol-anchored membrane family-domain-containing protein n=1 Tax=Exidia glandulosa HHB12029 TaxID=1314781 RepID=A0A165ZCA7_EXIGL|nr:hypothetical protein EXIGLDRAFT_731337 [Exidia glandulosa HHB12029]
MFKLQATVVLALVALALETRGALFPVKPVRSTWYTLDGKNRDIDLRWRDTHEEPRAAALGKVKVQLLFDDYVVTDLTPKIDGSAHEATVRVPHDVALASGSKYYLRFVPLHKEWHAVYTADFTIVNTTTPDVSPEAIASARSQAMRSTATTPALTSFRPSTTLTTATTPSAAQDALGTAVNAARAARMGGSSIRSKITFVIWPLLIGVALAI